MEKMIMKTKDLTHENIAKQIKLFPEIITEIEKDGKIIKTINIEKFKELFGDYADNNSEVYELTWAGKQKSRQKVVMPINKTLRPVPDDSVDFENTENLYVEGDNFEVLKLLQESYLNKVKMIYIDPPYNTGKDFVYKDNFTKSKDAEDKDSGAVDEEGNKLFKNTTTNGRFHSDWLSMMFERLVIAKDLLRDDGVIFISIDDNEVTNLRKICDDVFGEGNFIAGIPWIKRVSPANDSKWYSGDHEYIIIYSKNKDLWYPNRTKRTAEHDKYYKNPDNDSRGPWNSAAYTCNKSRSERPNLYYSILNPFTGDEIYPNTNAVWAYSKEKHEDNVKNKLLYWGSNGKSKSPRKKQFLDEAKDIVSRSYWHFNEVGSTQTATTDLRTLFDGASFSYPKPVKLLIKSIYQATDIDSVILDFFSGSATTAHAVMQLNAEDGGNRKFIMVQLPEETDNDSEAFKAGYKNICEIGKERIRRAAKKIKEDNKDKDLSNVDFGFRVFKTDSSNMKDVYYNPNEINQTTLTNLKDNIKEDRTDKDLLYQVLLELAIPISAKVEEQTLNNKTIYKVNDTFLIACFDDNIDLETIKQIAELNPLRIVFKDSSFKDDSTKVNCDEYLKNKLPNTIVKVI